VGAGRLARRAVVTAPSSSVDPLAPLAALPGVPAALEEVRRALARLYAHPANRQRWAASAAEAGVRAARASAGLDGAALDLPADGAVSDPVLAGSLRMAGELGRLLPVWRRTPLQAVARLHVLAAADLVPAADRDGLLGRPRTDPEVSARLNLLGQIVTQSSQRSGVVLVAVVHGELLSLAPFQTASGVVARAAARLAAVSSGLDPRALAVPEVGHLRAAAEYRAALDGFGSGSPDGLARWVLHCCRAWQSGAAEGLSIATARRPDLRR
jgi:hypothetical protein